MRRINMVYTFPVPDNPTGLDDNLWLACVIHELDKFLHGLLVINGISPYPSPSAQIADLMNVRTSLFDEQLCTAITDILSDSPHIFAYVRDYAIDRNNKYFMTTQFKIIGSQWAKLYLHIAKAERNDVTKD